MSRELVGSWFEAFCSNDVSKLQIADDFIHSSPFGRIEGSEAYLALVRQNAEAFFHPIIEILDVVECGDKFAVRFLLNDNPACDCFHVREGRITRIHSYYHVGEKPVL